MVAPLVAAGAVGLGAGLADSIFNQKKAPSFDPTQLYGFINQGANEQKGYAGQIVPGVTANNQSFLKGIQGAEGTATTNLASANKDYLSALDPITSQILKNQTGQLQQSVFGNVPASEEAAREAAAASGGLNRGAAAAQVAQVPINAAKQFNTGVAGLNLQSLQAKQQGVTNVYSQEAQQAAQKLGIDQNTYQSILSSGNAALIQQLQDLIGISQTQTGELINVGETAQGANIAQGAAAAQAQNAIGTALTNTGGTLLGMGLSPSYNPVPTAGAVPATAGATPVPPVQTTPGRLFTSGALTAPTGLDQLDPITRQILLNQQASVGQYQAPQ